MTNELGAGLEPCDAGPRAGASQKKTPAVPNSGMQTNSSEHGDEVRLDDRRRARGPAMKPITTLGRAAMISTVGLTLALIEGCTNCEV